MKKLFIAATLAVAAFASCAKEESVNVEAGFINNDNKISFNTYATQQTRGVIVGNTTEFGEKYGTAERGGFKVTAFTSTAGFDSEYMSAQINLNADDVWDYVNEGDVAYWPTSGSTLDFYAYAPFTGHMASSIEASKADGMTVEYTVPTAIADQVDFMYASAYDIAKDRDDALADNRVNLTFKHALTQLKFKGYTTSSDLKVDIKANGINVVNIPNSGVFTVPAAATPAPSWAVGVSTTTYPTSFDAVEGLSTTVADIATLNPIMVIPSQFEPWDKTASSATAQDNAYLTIECRVYVEDPDSAVREYLFGTSAAYATAYVPFDDAGVWAPSKIVTYTLNFETAGTDEEGEDNIIRIDFTADTVDWTDVAAPEIEM